MLGFSNLVFGFNNISFFYVETRSCSFADGVDGRRSSRSLIHQILDVAAEKSLGGLICLLNPLCSLLLVRKSSRTASGRESNDKLDNFTCTH